MSLGDRLWCHRPSCCQLWSHWLIQCEATDAVASSIDVFVECYSVTWPGCYHSHGRTDRWSFSMCPANYTSLEYTSLLSLRDLTKRVNVLNGSVVGDDELFLQLWSWQRFSTPTEWVINLPTLLVQHIWLSVSFNGEIHSSKVSFYLAFI